MVYTDYRLADAADSVREKHHMRRDPPTSSCQVKPQRPAPGTAGSGYIGSGVKRAQTLKLGSVVYEGSTATVSMLSLTVFEMEL